MYVYIYIYTHICIYLYIHLCMLVSIVIVIVVIIIHIIISIYTYIYIYIYIYWGAPPRLPGAALGRERRPGDGVRKWTNGVKTNGVPPEVRSFGRLGKKVRTIDRFWQILTNGVNINGVTAIFMSSAFGSGQMGSALKRRELHVRGRCWTTNYDINLCYICSQI